MERNSPKDTFQTVIVMGGLSDAQERPQELDLQVLDDAGHVFMMSIMTLSRYEKVASEDLDIGYDKDAPKVFVINDDQLALEAISEMLTTLDRHFFDPYVYELKEDE